MCTNGSKNKISSITREYSVISNVLFKAYILFIKKIYTQYLITDNLLFWEGFVYKN